MLRWVRWGLALASLLVFASGAVPLATAKTSKSGARKRSCQRALNRDFSRRPKRLTSSPPAALTSILGVLRRPSSSYDKPPADAIAGIFPSFYSSLWLGSARLLETSPNGTRYYLIPAIYSPPALPAVCNGLLPPSLRQPSHRRPAGPAVVLEPFSSAQSGGLPFTAAAIEAGRANLFDIAPVGATVPFYGVVPDGVASVTVSVTGGSPTSNPVLDNFFLTHIPNPRSGQPLTITQQWYAPSGALIKTTSYTVAVGKFTGTFSS